MKRSLLKNPSPWIYGLTFVLAFGATVPSTDGAITQSPSKPTAAGTLQTRKLVPCKRQVPNTATASPLSRRLGWDSEQLSAALETLQSLADATSHLLSFKKTFWSHKTAFLLGSIDFQQGLLEKANALLPQLVQLQKTLLIANHELVKSGLSWKENLLDYKKTALRGLTQNNGKEPVKIEGWKPQQQHRHHQLHGLVPESDVPPFSPLPGYLFDGGLGTGGLEQEGWGTETKARTRRPAAKEKRYVNHQHHFGQARLDNDVPEQDLEAVASSSITSSLSPVGDNDDVIRHEYSREESD